MIPKRRTGQAEERRYQQNQDRVHFDTATIAFPQLFLVGRLAEASREAARQRSTSWWRTVAVSRCAHQDQYIKIFLACNL